MYGNAKAEINDSEANEPEAKQPNEGRNFVSEVRSMFSGLESEIAERNSKIARNDEFIYGERLEKSLDIPVGHDFTPINWLRRTVEVHRAQFMGKGFAVDSSYRITDTSGIEDEEQKQRIKLENQKAKQYADMRRHLIQSILLDNGGSAFWSTAAENASAVGDAVIKAWFDEDNKKYTYQLIENVQHFYALWSHNDFRKFDATAYIYQISKQEAVRKYGCDDDVQTSPLGRPLAVIVPNYDGQEETTTVEAVTLMEITGTIEGWSSKNGKLYECKPGEEKPLNVVVVGDEVYQVIDEKKKLPKYYIFPNKRVRGRPWGAPDITDAAIGINLTYIEALSDWRTLAAKSNFPKFKGLGFAAGIQPPKPKPRTVEILPLADGQDIQPIAMSQAAAQGEADFLRQLNEMENQYIREVGISRQLFDMPGEGASNSNPATLTAMKSVSDITNTKRELWEPILRQMFTDALETLSEYDDNIKEVYEDDSDWSIKISWPSALSADDPSYHAMKLNQFNSGLLSIQSFLEDTGRDKQELDRISEEMENPTTAAIHGKMLNALASALLSPPGPEQPRVNINLRGDLTPGQEANLAYERGFNNGPFPPSAGPQGNAGLTAQANVDNQGFIEGSNPTGGMAVNRGPDGKAIQGAGQNQQDQQQLINGANSNQEGVGIMSQPGSGAPAVSPQGALNQTNQQNGG